MAFDVSAISKYTDEISQGLVKKAVLEGRTTDLVTILPGVKYKTKLHELANTVTIKAASCGFTTSGDVNFLDKDITVSPLEVKDNLCMKTLEQYWMGAMMRPGVATDVTPEIGQILADSYIEQIKKKNELTIWQGTLGAGTYPLFDGLLTFGTIANGAVDGTAFAGPHTANNIVANVDGIVALCPEEILDRNDLIMFTSYANYNLYVAALRTANLFHYNGATGSDYITVIPGTNIKLVATAGLVNTDVLFLTFAENLIVATDLVNEDEKFDIWYSKDNDEVRVNIQYKMGTQIYFPSQCVTNQADLS